MNSLYGNKFANYSDAELLGKVIGEHESKIFFENGGTLESLFSSNNNKIESFAIFNEMFHRYLEAELIDSDFLSSPKIVTKYLLQHFAGQEYESFIAVFLSAQHRVLGVVELFRGTLMHASVYPREVVKAALAHNAGSVIFSHNHPSGSLEESLSDKQLTAHLSEALNLVEIKVLDHFIIAGNQSMSFTERGIL